MVDFLYPFNEKFRPVSFVIYGYFYPMFSLDGIPTLFELSKVIATHRAGMPGEEHNFIVLNVAKVGNQRILIPFYEPALRGMDKAVPDVTDNPLT